MPRPIRRRTALPVPLSFLLLATLVAGCATSQPRSASPAVASNADSAASLIRCTLLIPLRYNDGTAIPEREFQRLEDRLFDQFGGYTVAGHVRGTYRMSDGTRAEDESLAIWIAVPRARIGELRAAAARIATELRQESLYFERGNGTVEFVPGAADD